MNNITKKIAERWAKKSGFTKQQHGYIMFEAATEEAFNAALDLACKETTNGRIIAAIKALKVKP